MMNRAFSVFAIAAVLMIGLPGVGTASLTNNYGVWSYGGLYVDTYRNFGNGDIGVTFENESGTVFTNWANSGGVNQCPGQPMLRIYSGYPEHDEIREMLLAAGLSHKPLHVWFEGINGICYIKQVTVAM